MFHHDCLAKHVLAAFVFVLEVSHQDWDLLWEEAIFKEEVEFLGFEVGVVAVDLFQQFLDFEEERDLLEEN